MLVSSTANILTNVAAALNAHPKVTAGPPPEYGIPLTDVLRTYEALLAATRLYILERAPLHDILKGSAKLVHSAHFPKDKIQ